MLKRSMTLVVITALLMYMTSINEAKKKRRVQGPKMGRNYSTNCTEFSRYARFNPYSVLNDIWFVFFYWGAHRPQQMYRFFIPTSDQVRFLHKMFDGKVTKPVNWTARLVLMQGRHNRTQMLVERGDRGQYWSYLLARVKKVKIKPKDLRLRQHDNGRLLGLMECKSENMYVMSRLNEVPLQSKLQEEAARFGFRARRGKSYLYQGHEWMPVPEADENDIFTTILPEINKTMTDPAKIDLSKLVLPEAPTGRQPTCKARGTNAVTDCSESSEESDELRFDSASAVEMNNNHENQNEEKTTQEAEKPKEKDSLIALSTTKSLKLESSNELKEVTFDKESQLTNNVKGLETLNVVVPSQSNDNINEHHNKHELDTSANDKKERLPIRISNEQSIDISQDLKKAPNLFENVAVLEPVENQIFIGTYSENNDMTPSQENLPPKCYKMEFVEESIVTSPANLPAILNNFEKSEITTNSKKE